MANYYHEARAHVRRLKELTDDSKRRAERRAEHAGANVLSLVKIGTSFIRG